jgi:hypothetical protein
MDHVFKDVIWAITDQDLLAYLVVVAVHFANKQTIVLFVIAVYYSILENVTAIVLQEQFLRQSTELVYLVMLLVALASFIQADAQVA